MKRSMRVFVLLLSTLLAGAAFAGPGHHGGHHHGGYHGGFNGGYRGGYGHHAWGNHWVGPVLGAAIIGTAIYASSAPTYAVAPPVVTVVPPAPRVAYFCGTTQQYYPTVPTCNVPWQLVSY